MESLLEHLRGGEEPWHYVVLGLAAAAEYFFPPAPADLIALFGAFLASAAGYSLVLVYVSLIAGSMTGAMLTYWIGRYFADYPSRLPKFLRTGRAEKALSEIELIFARRGVMFLCVNRFVPILRAFAFIAAGLAGLRPGKVFAAGLVSAGVWNAILLALGYAAGSNWRQVQTTIENYSAVASAVLVIAFISWYVRRKLKQRKELEGSATGRRPD